MQSTPSRMKENITENEQRIYKNSDTVTGFTVIKLSPPWGSEAYIDSLCCDSSMLKQG